jgi:hypothetical protein
VVKWLSAIYLCHWLQFGGYFKAAFPVRAR